jgi:TetR/AcrR family transcriptional repressor of nem operon
MTTDTNDVRQRILDTGRAIIISKGFSAVGLNQILGAAGVPKGSFYHYFKSKEQFGEAMLDSYVAEYLDCLDAVLATPARTAAERLMLYWDSWNDPQCAECKCLVVKLGAEVSDLSDAMRCALLRGTDQIIDRLARCIAAGGADGSLPGQSDPALTAQTLYQLWLGAALLTKLRREPSAMEGALRATRQLLRLPDGAMH